MGKTRIVISACLAGRRCRYDGELLDENLAARMPHDVELVEVCPEMEIGLGLPREKIRLVTVGDSVSVLRTDNGEDITDTLQRFAKNFCESNAPVQRFILKAKSPSCGMGNCKLFDSLTAELPSGVSDGLFYAEARNRFPDAVFASEEDLTEQAAIDEFLVKAGKEV